MFVDVHFPWSGKKKKECQLGIIRSDQVVYSYDMHALMHIDELSWEGTKGRKVAITKCQNQILFA